jgi:hypothetical protein
MASVDRLMQERPEPAKPCNPAPNDREWDDELTDELDRTHAREPTNATGTAATTGELDGTEKDNRTHARYERDM